MRQPLCSPMGQGARRALPPNRCGALTHGNTSEKTSIRERPLCGRVSVCLIPRKSMAFAIV